MFTRTQRLGAYLAGLASRFVFGFTLRHIRHSCRIVSDGPLDDIVRSGEQVILSLWHQDVLTFFQYMAATASLEHRRRFVMLASRSFDGELTARVVQPWGFTCVRGSRGKKGARAALRGLRRALKNGSSVIVVADGPQPPAKYFQPGPVYLAKATGVPLYVVRMRAHPRRDLRDRYQIGIPLPRCTFASCSTGPIAMSDDLEEMRERAQSTLEELCARADRMLDASASAPGIRIGARAARSSTRTRLL